MPEVHFKVAWPDGEQQIYYSPSTVIYKSLQAGHKYSQADFHQRVNSALEQASQRVAEKYGYACSAAADEQQKINFKLSCLREAGNAGAVTVLAFS
ncbi:putative repeat protein (TIGR04042 family) [Alteromonadaceae bacterium 2753L.S.0a.02]|nr:putative repeat protein (TIGR04042 family) [Alteromonadaceae bacterium 2753L.S.0a.02]